MSTIKKLMMTAAGGESLAIEDVFSTYLYAGNGSTQTITNGIDLAGEGGLVWLKARSLAQGHTVTDTERGSNFVLQPNTTDAQVNTGSLYVSSFNSDGFSIGTGSNTSSQTFASWTFRKAPRFFDVVTYTGTGSARTVSHNLGVAPGCIIAKNVSRGTEGWRVYHRSQGATKYAMLQSTNAFAAAPSVWNNTEPTDSVFTTGSDTGINGSGDTIVAYLFAHDPLGPSGDGSDGLIACGSYTGNGSADGPEIDLGWEPQWILTKNASDAYDWYTIDNMRGAPVGVSGTEILKPNTSDAAAIGGIPVYNFSASGFKVAQSGVAFNQNGSTHIYIAIRRGPMRQPTSGTEVFAAALRDGTEPGFNSGFPVDMFIFRNKNNVADNLLGSRLTGTQYLVTNSTASEGTISSFETDYQDGWNSAIGASTTIFSWMFRRAPGFFDVVAYTGNGPSVNTVKHNLGAKPELIILKVRSVVQNWPVYHDITASGFKRQLLNNFNGSDTVRSYNSDYGLYSEPTDTQIQLDDLNANLYNGAGQTYIAYLFATLPGVSKVGSYTGNGTSQTINCGFTSGARFVLIKRTDSAGDWYVWDSARGIVAGNDPHLSLNTTAAEVTTDDSIDPDSSGFIVNQVAATNVNVSSASYIFLALA